MLQDYLNEVLSNFQRLAELDVEPRLMAAADAIIRALAERKAVLVAGNGGSAADALHIAAELVARFKRDRSAFKVIALPANVSTLTAIANDDSFDRVFARQVEAYGEPGGVFIAISTSGNSNNVVRAAELARQLGMTVISLTGEDGGRLGEHSDILLNVPSRVTAHIQEMHICLYHVLCDRVEQALSDARP